MGTCMYIGTRMCVRVCVRVCVCACVHHFMMRVKSSSFFACAHA
nr:MAG TPA: hypothetical protein [Caudoviricetes sp.]